MVFAPMQTGADGLRHGWGRRVTDRFSPQPHAPFPLIWYGGVLRGGRRGADGDSRIPAAQPGEPRVGEVPLRSGGQRKAEVPAGRAACQAQGLEAAGLPTSAHLSPPRPQPPPPLTQTSLSSLPASLSSECLSLWGPVLALSSFLSPLPFARL